MRCAWLLAIVVYLQSACSAGAWGASGHSIIAELAQRRLNERAASEVAALLGHGGSLASVSGWADEFAKLRPETRSWHFVNIPYDAAGYDGQRDCKAGDCVVDAIARSRAVLADEAQPRASRAEALKLLIHFVADIHQPLHCADRGDLGASRLPVEFFDGKTSLHMVWDVGMIEKRTFYWGSYVDALEETWTGRHEATAVTGGTPEEWANGAHKLAVEVAYAVPADLKLGEDYYNRASPHVDEQLALAALRLARMLNEIWPAGK